MTAVPERPPMPDLAKGYDLLMHSGTRGRRDGRPYSAVRVVSVGPKYVGVVPADRYEAYVADPQANRWHVRKFLREDWREGDRGKRVGCSASILAREQAEYDDRLGLAMRTVRDAAGLDTRARSAFDPRQHPGHFLALAEVVHELMTDLGIEATPDE